MKTKLLFLAFALLGLMTKAQVGYISTIAGTGVAGHTGDGGLATAAKLGITFGIVFDAAGNIIFADNATMLSEKSQHPLALLRKLQEHIIPIMVPTGTMAAMVVWQLLLIWHTPSVLL